MSSATTLSLRPWIVYGSAISYYTGKFEGYLRYKEIPYEFVAASPRIRKRMQKETGAAQLPAVELPDGRWMTDSTPMIDWIEGEYPSSPVIPADPTIDFLSRLLEDYAEEWLWRPAMHYRWSHRGDAARLSRTIVDEILPRVPVPKAIPRFLVRQRQFRGWVSGDGVTDSTRAHVEGSYLATLDRLSTVFEDRPFILGDRPSLADFGFFASMFRHFSQDPTPAEIMRQRAPAVFEWQARLWNTRGSTTNGDFVTEVPDDLGPILVDVGSAYLPYLNANARGWKAGLKRHDATIQGTDYHDLPVSQYRVWCLERLRAHVDALDEVDRKSVAALLETHGAWEPLWEIETPGSRYDDSRVPFRGRKVHYDNADQ